SVSFVFGSGGTDIIILLTIGFLKLINELFSIQSLPVLQPFLLCDVLKFSSGQGINVDQNHACSRIVFYVISNWPNRKRNSSISQQHARWSLAEQGFQSQVYHSIEGVLALL